ncbi:MAG: cytidine deaminase [Oscillospiraceae bacterium]|nr:cytidine deaminase [Oscillospiraceae bacterium]
MTDKELIDLARGAKQHSYSPYSHFAVGAAIECDGGLVFTGCNIENASFGATLCAEAVALSSAVAEGHRSFRRIAIVSDSEQYCYPCGSCRQLLQEFAPDIEVLAARNSGAWVSYHLNQLLPKPFQFRG